MGENASHFETGTVTLVESQERTATVVSLNLHVPKLYDNRMNHIHTSGVEVHKSHPCRYD